MMTFNPFWDASMRGSLTLKYLTITFNPFWDASFYFFYLPAHRMVVLSIPFGMLHEIRKKYKDGVLVFFQSLLGCFTSICWIFETKKNSFNPFWDASKIPKGSLEYRILPLSIPFGMLQKEMLRNTILMILSFNPFWDASLISEWFQEFPLF